MTDLSRRLFLASLAMAAAFPRKALAGAVQRSAAGKSDSLLSLVSAGTGPSKLVAISVPGGTCRQFDLPMPGGLFGAHSVEVCPTDPSLLAILPFRLDKMVLFSLKKGAVIRELKAKPGFLFSGHGMFHSDGRQFMATEYRADDSGDGMISLRSAADGSVQEEISTGARHPHQIASLDGETAMLAISHYGFHEGPEKRDLKSKIVFFDFNSRKALQTVDSPIPNAALCHIAAGPSGSGQVFISVQDRVMGGAKADGKSPQNKFFPAPVFSARRSQPSLTEWDSQGKNEKLLFSFSTAFSERAKRLAMVHIGSSAISIWDSGEQKLLRLLEFPGQNVSAVNVSANGEKFFYNLSSQGKSKVVLIDALTLKEESVIEIPVSGSISHHMSRTPFLV